MRKTRPHAGLLSGDSKVQRGFAAPNDRRGVAPDLLREIGGRVVVRGEGDRRVDTRLVRRTQRAVVVAIVAGLMLGSAGLCEVAMAVLACRPASAECPLHAAPVDMGERSHLSASVPSCCVVSSDAPVPVLAAPEITTAVRVPQVSMPRADLAVVPTLTITAVARSSPVHRPAVPRHLLLSVFLV